MIYWQNNGFFANYKGNERKNTKLLLAQMTPPRLQTERLSLFPLRQEDEGFLHACFTDPFVRKYLWDDEIIDLNLTRGILVKNESQFELEQSGLWRIILSEAETNIGIVGLWYFFEEPQPQLLYALLPDFIGHGYATEASQTILTYAFDQLGFSYVDAACDPPHETSQNLARRLGMQFQGERLEDGKPTHFFRICRVVDD